MGGREERSEESTLPSSAEVYAGRYALQEELGRGGMGRVMRARDVKLGREVALKLLAPGAHTDQQRVRFEQEARAAGALNHPNILAVYDIGEERGEPFIVTELLEGETLRTLLSRGPVAPARALEITLQLADGLAAAHAAGIVHRDVKPENLFLTRQGRLKILDFGIAKLLEPAVPGAPRTDTGVMMGTPGYMSPEQVQGGHATARSDVFAFGAVLHEMLSGEGPFARESGVDSAHAILHDPPAPLPPSTLSRLVAHCLQKDPAARPADAGEVLVELREIPPPAPRKTRAVWLLAVALALLAAAAIVALRPKRAATPPSIAVLPFVNLSSDKDQEYFSDGIAEEILDLLAKVPGLHVAARTSAFSFKGKNEDVRAIAGKLNVATLLEGTVRKAGDRIRITTQLINAADGYHLWSETYDRKLTDIFAVQDEIGQAVVAALKLKLLKPPSTQERRTVNPEAFNEYLLGRQFFHRNNVDGFRRAAQAFEKAVTLDPGYAPAWAGLGMATYWAADGAVSPAEITVGRDRALAAAEKAIALAPDLPDGYLTRAFVEVPLRWDFEGARADLERALLLKPDDADTLNSYAYVTCRALGSSSPRLIAAARRATELDPLNARVWFTLGQLLSVSGQLGPGREAFNRSLEISPEQTVTPYWLGITFLLEGRPAAAKDIFPRSTNEVFRLAGSAMAERDLAHSAESQRALDELIAKHGQDAAYQIGEVHAWRGETDLALEWLDRARVQRDGGLTFLKVDPLLRKVRSDPRYRALLKKINLPAD